MESHFVRFTDEALFAELITRSIKQPVVIFKHSTTCPISAVAYEEMRKFNREVMLVEVQRARNLSNEIERRTGVTHESPQVLVLRNGKVVWDASHFKIKAEAVSEAVLENS